MATRFTKIAAVLFSLVWPICASGQVSKPASVKPTPELRSFVPTGHVLRGAWHTNLTPSGETIFLYDDGQEVLPQTCLAVLQGRRELKLVETMYVGDFVLVPLNKSKNGLAVVSHEGEDSSDNEFAIFVASGDSYKRIFYQQTTEGQMKIISTNPLSFTLSSAAAELDPKDPERSCVWCPHRFRIKSYVWDGEKFRLTNKMLTKKFLKPADPMPGNAFIMQAPARAAKKN